jgi:hypothetical protein
VVSSTPWPHFTPGKDPVPILQEAGWAPGPVWTGGKSRPHRDSILDRPARNQSLYRLSYPAATQRTPVSCAFHNGTGRLDLHLSQCCATPLIQLHPTTIIPGNVLPHNWMSKLELKSGFYYIPINLQSHKCCSMLFGQCCQCVTRHSMGHQLAAYIIFQTTVCLLSQHFNVSMVACLHCWLIFGLTILVHDILLFLQQLSLSFTPALVLEYLGFHMDSRQG